MKQEHPGENSPGVPYVLSCREFSAGKLLSEEGWKLYGASGIECGFYDGHNQTTLFWPCRVIFPKEIFLNRTHGRIPCSAKLFAGSTAGYLRKTKSSFLNLISRFRILLDLWCDNGSCWYNFLNLLMMFFLPERYSSGVKAEC